MNRTRRVTANLPTELLKQACEASGEGITDTLIQGLEMIRRLGAQAKAQQLKGRLFLDIDLELSRERSRH